MVDAGAIKGSAVPVKQIFLNDHAVDRQIFEIIGNTSWGVSYLLRDMYCVGVAGMLKSSQ